VDLIVFYMDGENSKKGCWSFYPQGTPPPLGVTISTHLAHQGDDEPPASRVVRVNTATQGRRCTAPLCPFALLCKGPAPWGYYCCCSCSVLPRKDSIRPSLLLQ